MDLFRKPNGVQSRWVSFENPTGDRAAAAKRNLGAKGWPFDAIAPGETKTLLDLAGRGVVRRIWITIDNRAPEMLRSLRLDIYWEGHATPAVSAPLGDFFGVGLGHRTAFENALFSDPEGRSFNCFIPMPFREHARITVTNESDQTLPRLFYDIDLTTGDDLGPDTLYFHAFWNRENPNVLGRDYTILPRVYGKGRYLGCNVGLICNPAYLGAWWGEGEVKMYFGNDESSTLCGTGAEDYIGTGWGQGVFVHRTQGCLLAENGRYCFYRYHVDDPVYFDDALAVTIQTMGGDALPKVVGMLDAGVPLIPVSVDAEECGFVRLLEAPDFNFRAVRDGWCNFWRQDDWSSTACFYLDKPTSELRPLADVGVRITAPNQSPA